jgi:WD40 repeat protein
MLGLAVMAAETADAPVRPQLFLQVAHTKYINATAYFPDGKTLATASSDGTVKLWDTATGDLTRTLTGHRHHVLSLAISPDGQWLAGGGGALDPRVLIWNTKTGVIAHAFSSHGTLVTKVQFSADGRLLVSRSNDGLVYLTDIATGQVVSTVHAEAMFDTNGRPCLLSPNGRWLACAELHQVRVWDMRTGAVQFICPEAANALELAFSPDSAVLFVSSSSMLNSAVTAWDTATGKRRFTTGVAAAHIACSTDGRILVARDGENHLRCWNTADGAELPSVVPACGIAYSGVGDPRVFAPDGNTFAGVSIYSGRAETSPIIRDTLTGAIISAAGSRSRRVTALALSPDGTLAAAGGESSAVFVWNLQTGSIVQALPVPDRLISALAFASTTPPQLAASSWNLTPLNTAYSGNVVTRLWQPRTGTLLRLLEGQHKPDVNGQDQVYIPDGSSAAYSPDGRLLATLNFTRTVSIWDTTTGTLRTTLAGHTQQLNAVVFTPDGQSVISAGGGPAEQAEILLWNPATGAKVREFRGGHMFGARTLAISPDGTLLASGGYDGLIRIWNVATGTIQRTFKIPLIPIARVTFSHDGQRVAAAAWNRTIHCWDVQTGTLVSTYTGHTDRVATVAFSRDDRQLLSGSYDGTVKVWDIASGRILVTLLVVVPPGADYRTNNQDHYLDDSDPLWLAVTPEGYYDCADGADQIVKWRFGDDQLYPFYQFEETFRRPDLVRKALKGEVIAEKVLTVERVPPTCHFVSPTTDQQITGETVRVMVAAADDREVKDLRLYVNGAPLPDNIAKGIAIASKAISVPSKAIAIPSKPIAVSSKDASMRVAKDFTVDVPLPPGETQILLRAVIHDDEQNSADCSVTVHRTNTAPVLGDLYLLCVGLTKYRNPLYNLVYPAADAEAIAAVMRAQQGKQYAHVYATVLTDNKATVAGIQAAVQALTAAKPADTVMVFLSGHGVQQEGKFYFAPYGIMVNDIANTCLSWQTVTETLSGIYAKKLLFTDACHSGAKLGERQATSDQLASAVRRTGIVMMASSQGDEFSFEDTTLQHGAFTAALLEACAGKADVNGDHILTLPELELYVPKRVSELTQGLQHPHLVSVQDFNPQTPIVRLGP